MSRIKTPDITFRSCRGGLIWRRFLLLWVRVLASLPPRVRGLLPVCIFLLWFDCARVCKWRLRGSLCELYWSGKHKCFYRTWKHMCAIPDDACVDERKAGHIVGMCAGYLMRNVFVRWTCTSSVSVFVPVNACAYMCCMRSIHGGFCSHIASVQVCP